MFLCFYASILFLLHKTWSKNKSTHKYERQFVLRLIIDGKSTEKKKIGNNKNEIEKKTQKVRVTGVFYNVI